MKILVTVDGSSFDSAAVAVAADYAQTKDAGLHILTVVLALLGSDLEMPIDKRERFREEMRKRGQDIVEAAAGLARKAGFAHPETHCKPGNSVPTEIVNFVRDQKIDLLIMGSQGGHGPIGSLLGSVTAKVLQQVPCSVHVVKKPH